MPKANLHSISIDRNFSGEGQVTHLNNATVPCQFNMFQRSNGEITVNCDFKSADLDLLLSTARNCGTNSVWFWHDISGLSFEGSFGDGLMLHLTESYRVSHPEENRLRFHVTLAEASRKTLPHVEPSHLSFRIVNHEMPPMPEGSHTLPSNLVVNGAILQIPLSESYFLLRGIDGNHEILKELEENKSVAVTTEIVIPATDNYQLENVKKKVGNICSILTLMSGNRVNWLSYEVTDIEGNIIKIGFQDAVTRAFQHGNLLNSLSDSRVFHRWGNDLYRQILERMVSNFETQNLKWNLFAIINSWNESINSDHFPEQQGQLLTNCMEMLRYSYLKHGGQEFVLPCDLFDKKETQKLLIKDVKTLFAKHFPINENWPDEQRKEHRAKLSNMTTHIKGANRHGFKHSLIAMSEELNIFSQQVYENPSNLDTRGFILPTSLEPTEAQKQKADDSSMQAAKIDSINAFVKIRDQLTHQGLFLVHEIDERKGWNEKRVNEARIRQLRFVERFVGIFIASILGWHQPLPSVPLAPED